MFRRIVLLLLLVVALGIGLVLARRLFAPGGSSSARTASPALAEEAMSKLGTLREGKEAVLNEAELTSLLRYRIEPWAWGPVLDPVATISGDTLRLAGGIETDQLPMEGGLEAIRVLLPDTTPVEVAGTLHPEAPGSVRLQIERLEVAGMPVPARYYAELLDRVGGAASGSDSGSIVVQLPEPVGSARAERNLLILTP